ncbi:MAG TPA: hypothetical protein VF230_09685 [Acidimicrobiales bacterium]
MTRRSLASPTPALCVTTRGGVGQDSVAAVEASVAALREVARRMGADVVGAPLRVEHAGAPDVVEVALPVRSLPDDDPPAPLAAEVLTPGTVVDDIDV